MISVLSYLIAVGFLIIVFAGIILFILLNQYKVIESHKKGSKWILVIVNRFGNCQEWILSTNSEYGQRLTSGTFRNGSKFSKMFLHGGYKGFTPLEKNKDLWHMYP